MPLRILELGKQFRPGTSHVYPPFKNGKYMEEYFYDYVIKHQNEINTDLVYIPIFWTNLQNHPGFSNQKRNYEILLSSIMGKMPFGTKYFTVVQHDDGPQLKLTKDVLVFGACTGNIPLPLIYEDINNTLINKAKNIKKEQKEQKYLASFIGSSTHKIRMKMRDNLVNKNDIYLQIQGVWSANVSQNLSDIFIEKTLESKFCLAPRGYGRSSFRFFEAMLLNTIPVYFWDDIEWLPYKDMIDYSKFSVSIQEKDIGKTYEILKSISDEKYISMLEELEKNKRLFTLEGMSEYIIKKITS
jgi:hypothetical protein